MNRTINNKSLIEFLDKVKKAKASRSREIRITMDEAENMSRELLRHLLVTDKPAEQESNAPIVDGGTFKKK